MNVGSEIAVGTIAIVKVGRNEVEVTVTGITEHGWMVKSRSTGREFEVMHLERIVNGQTAGEISSPVPECGNPGRQGNRDESLDSDRSENAGTDALQRSFPRNQDP